MDSWSSLSMRQRADVMKLAVENGIHDLDTIRSAYNEFAEGGSIHIKPSHRGRLTELKERTGKTEAELYNDGNPAHKKMVVFARNSRKWKHGLGGNLFEMGGPTRGRMPAHPSTKNKDKDPEAWKKAQEFQAEMEQRRQQNEEEARKRRLQKVNEHDRKAERYKSYYGSVMSTLSDPSNISPFTGSAVKEAAEQQRQEKLDKAHDIKKGIDATVTAAELISAGYGAARGATHLGRYMAQRAVNRAGMNATTSQLSNLNSWNNMTAAVDAPQIWMNGIGGAADGYQWITADNSLDAWENGLETGANVAGVIGGTNWFRNIPALQSIGGNKIDAVLDGLGYSAAAWDMIKNLPPLSTYLEIGRENSKKKSLGGNLYPDGGYVREVNGHPIAFDYEGNLIDQVTGEKGYMPLPEVSVTANPDDVARGRAQRWYRDFGTESNDATSVADGRRQNSHLDEWGIEGAAKDAAWAKDHPVLNNVGLGLSTIPFAVAVTPAVVGGGELAATALANPYVDAALTSMGGAHAAQSLANGEANWMTALELAPLGRLAKPLYEGVVQPGMRLFNSPLTGNWTKIGNREYRLSPNSLGANGNPIESRSIAPQITAENAASMTPEQWTAAQDAAIARGDMAEAQRLRDLHFKVSAPDNKLTTKLYHGTDSEWNSYDPTYFSSGSGDLGAWGKGLYLSGYKNVAERYGKNIKSLYAYARNPLEVKPTLGTWYDTPTENAAYFFNREEGATQEIKDILKGKDAVNKYREITGDHWITTHEPYEEVVIPDGRNLKSADAVTYDVNGIRIPLGMRDNFKINDIRYGLLPFLGLGTAATLYGRSNE